MPKGNSEVCPTYFTCVWFFIYEAVFERRLKIILYFSDKCFGIAVVWQGTNYVSFYTGKHTKGNLVIFFLVCVEESQKLLHTWSGPSKICGRQPFKKLKGYGLLSTPYPFKFVCQGCLPQILFGPLLNTLSYVQLYVLLCFGLSFFFISAIFSFVHLDLLLHFWKAPNNIVLII